MSVLTSKLYNRVMDRVEPIIKKHLKPKGLVRDFEGCKGAFGFSFVIDHSLDTDAYLLVTCYELLDDIKGEIIDAFLEACGQGNVYLYRTFGTNLWGNEKETKEHFKKVVHFIWRNDYDYEVNNCSRLTFFIPWRVD